MSDVTSILIDDARQSLLREIAPAVGRKDLHEAFAAWLLPGDTDLKKGASCDRWMSASVLVRFLGEAFLKRFPSRSGSGAA